MDMKALARKHLERRLAPLREVDLTRPQRGWLRAMREATGMTTRQLARRMGRAQSVIVDAEKSEERDSITLASSTVAFFSRANALRAVSACKRQFARR